MIHNCLKCTSLQLVPCGWRVRSLDWRLSQPGFGPGYGKLVCLATLMSSDRTKQICLWMTIYILYDLLVIHLLNGSKYCSVSRTILLNISYFFYFIFIFLQLNNQTVLILTIQFSISHLFALNLNGQKVVFDSEIGPY